MKKEFLLNEIWTLTFSAAFQRANIYKDCTEEQKRAFKSNIREYIEKEILLGYFFKVNDEQHLYNINAVVRQSMKNASILQNGRITFGVSQKILNLHLKYRWCMGDIPTPPHFPVDRMIQGIIKYPNIVSWTRMDDSKEYMDIINYARKINQNNSSIAEFELEHFERRFKMV